MSSSYSWESLFLVRTNYTVLAVNFLSRSTSSNAKLFILFCPFFFQSKEKMMKGVRRGCVRLKGAIIGIDDQDVNTFTITVDHKTFHFQVSSVQGGQKTTVSHVWLTIFHFSGNNSPHTHTPNHLYVVPVRHVSWFIASEWPTHT